MPELPEVETVRRGLTSLIEGKTIAEVQVFWPKLIDLRPQETLAQWQDYLRGQTIQAVGRRGKYLWLDFGSQVLVFHLRMEGKCHVYPPGQEPKTKPKHVHLIMTFKDGSHFHYEDVRKFGRFSYMAKDQLESYFASKKLGPEPTKEAFDLAHFRAQLAASKRALKPLLLDQTLVAGLGNIYVDEVCFKARIHPARPACDLTVHEVKRLHAAIIEILAVAVQAGGSTIRTYRNSLGAAGTYQESLAVYGRVDEPCERCGRLIHKVQFGGRGTHFCPHCQPARLKHPQGGKGHA